MSDQQSFKTDLEEAAALAAGYFQNKYTNKLAKAVRAQRQKIVEAPPDEIRLLSALKAFLPSDRQADADQLMEMCLFLASAQSIGNELRQSVGHPFPIGMRSGGAPERSPGGFSGGAAGGNVREDLLGMLLLMAFQ
jgi:hypothetical protein